jgi:hypothetical protein
LLNPSKSKIKAEFFSSKVVASTDRKLASVDLKDE